MADEQDENDPQGRRLGLPYDWRKPTRRRLSARAWNRDGKVLTPKTFGWGYGVNFGALWHKLTGR